MAARSAAINQHNQMSGRSRNWCFTLFGDATETDPFYYSLEFDGRVNYAIAGEEFCPDTGRRHLQGYLELKDSRTLTEMKSRFNGTAHWEPRQGTQSEAIEYCKKEGEWLEFGQRAMTFSEAAHKGVEERWALAKAGKFEELPPEQIKTYEYICAKFTVVEDRTFLDNIWIYGPSGCGKSRYVRDNYPEFYNKGINKWWDGYRHEPTVLVDDLDPNHAERSGIGYYLKIWGDHYAFNAEVKGGMLRVRPKTVIVTSQYLPEQVFTDHETVTAVRRRFSVKRVVDGQLYDVTTNVNFNH